MKPHRARSQKMLRFLSLLVIAALLALSVSSVAQADPAALTQAQKDAQQLRELIDRLDAELSKVDEDYNYAAQQLKDTQAAKAETQARLKKVESQLQEAQGRLQDRLVEIYKAGRGSALEVLVGASSLSDLIQRARDLSRISQQDSELVTQVEDYLAAVAKKKAELARQEKEEKAQVAELATAKQKVEAQLAAQEKALKGKEAQVAQLREEERARQAELAAAARAAAKAAALRTASASADSSSADTQQGVAATTKVPGATSKSTVASRPPGSSTGVKSSTTTTAPRPSTTTTERSSGDSAGGGSGASGSRAQLVEIALRYVGVPYVWAGASPSGFDCSGFVMYVFSKIGVQLPHSSAMQYGYGTHISKGELQPGDLVFFYSPIHHVGIYIGNGQMINARTGGVQIESAFWDSYVGATRILD